MPLTQIGSHEVQAIVTVTLLAATSLLALFCDYLRYRMYRKPAATKGTHALQTALAPTLVPEFKVRVRVSPRQPNVYRGKLATRLAAAREQQRTIEGKNSTEKKTRRAS